jgi:hypothetical protein
MQDINLAAARRFYFFFRSSPSTRYISESVYWVGLSLVIGFTVHYWRSPSGTGKAIAVLGAAAVLMAIRGDRMAHPEKILWMLVVFALLYVELRSIDRDRADNQRQQAELRQQETKQFEAILEENRKDLSEILKDQSAKFTATMGEFGKSHLQQDEMIRIMHDQDSNLNILSNKPQATILASHGNLGERAIRLS